MEYCAGGDLTNYIKKRGRVEGLEYVPSPGAALQYYPHPRTGGLEEIAVRSFLRQLGELDILCMFSFSLICSSSRFEILTTSKFDSSGY